MQLCQTMYNKNTLSDFALCNAVQAQERQSSFNEDSSQLYRVQGCQHLNANNTMSGFTPDCSVQSDECQSSSNSDSTAGGLLKIQLCQSLYSTNVPSMDEIPNSTVVQDLGRQSSSLRDCPTQSDLMKIQSCQSMDAKNMTSMNDFPSDVKLQTDGRKLPQSVNPTETNLLKIQLHQSLDANNPGKNNEITSHTSTGGHERQHLNTSNSLAAGLFADLWNGHPIILPSQSWALHRVKNTGVGPLIVINEMMANDHGIPFPLKQLVITSAGSMMALVLNQVIDVSIISVMPLQTVQNLQEALKYFDQIDCEYVYLEPASL